MLSRSFVRVYVVAFVAAVSQQASAAPSPSPVPGANTETEGLVAAYRSCCPKEGQESSTPCQAVDSYFDYSELAQTTAAPLQSKLNAKQKKRLLSALKDVFARTARQSGKSLCHAKPTIGVVKPHAKGSEVALEVLEPGEDIPTKLSFVWRKAGARWRVVDLELEGGSLITDYQNQFSRIEHKEGADGLLRRVEARRENNDAAAKAKNESKG